MADTQCVLADDLHVGAGFNTRTVTKVTAIAQVEGVVLWMHPDTRSELAAAVLKFGPLVRDPARLVARLGVRIETSPSIPAGLIQFHPST